MAMRKRLNKLRAASFRNRALTDHPSHREAKALSNRYGEEVLAAKRQHWTSYLEDMSASDIWTAHRYLRDPVGDGGSPQIPTLRTKDNQGRDVEVNDSQEKAALFGKLFFPPPPVNSTVPANFDYPEPLPDPPQIAKAQLEHLIRRLSPYKAYGPDEIPNVVLQRCLDLLIDYLLHIYRAILKLGTYYDPWREFTTVVLRKPGKSNYELPKAHQPIALLSTVAKVLTGLVAEDVSRLVELHQLLPKTHFGGRPGRTTTDAIHFLAQSIKGAWQKGEVASILFLDVEGAFPDAVTNRLIHNLKRRRIPAVYVTFIKQLLTGRRTRLKFDDFVSESINVLNGIGQGDPLSMILYVIYNADLLEIPGDDEHEKSLGYVDDIALVATGKDFIETGRRLQHMMTKEDGGLQWSEEHNSRFEASKSVVLHATRRTQADPRDPRKRIPLDRTPLRIAGQLIKEVSNFKYLGVQIDAQLNWKEQTQRATANATKWILQFRRLTRPSTGVSSKLMRQLFLAVALPKITYSIDVWFSPPHKPVGATKNAGSVGSLRSLQKIQRIATLAITGSLRTTPTDLLDAHAGVLPLELALSKACHRAAVRLLTLPKTHPLFQPLKQARRVPPRKHKSPMDSLLATFGLHKARMEVISPATEDPRRIMRFRTIIPESRECSIEEEDQDKADFKVFSDGSGQEGGVGAAAVIYKKGRSRPLRHLKSYLGPLTEHNSFEGEAVGGLLACWLIRTTPGTSFRTVSIYIDNQALIKVSIRPKATSGQHLVQAFADAADNLRAKTTIRWISSHSEVKGNEQADSLAKEAAIGKASRRASLPPLLQKKLPTSASATKQEHHEGLKRQWRAAWMDSLARRQRFELVDDNFPFTGFRRRQDNLTRGEAALLMQIRSGHVPLNSFLFKIGKSESKLCQQCRGNAGEEAPAETVTHFLFQCSAFAAQRRQLARAIGGANMNLKNIMLETKRMGALVKYINRTGRFNSEDRA